MAFATIFVSISAVLISAIAMVQNGIALKSRAKNEYVSDLEKRVETLEGKVLHLQDQLQKSNQERNELEEENVRLMKKILRPD